MDYPEISAFGEILIYLIGGLLFVMGGLVTAWIVRPHRPNEEKLSTYESGEQPLGSAWVRFNIRFYIVALLFVLFEVEIVFLFPWATVFGQKELIEQTNGLWGWFSLIEMVVFIGILALGLAYAWVKGYLDWPKQEGRTTTDYKSPVPKTLYDRINKKYSSSN
ncbi:NADH ubiquinone oxidoreductase chain A [Fulvivirga imtechensis AK7]|uniref:NADH-quinone oxidoreductase subunit A n=1 Tax=Fulvivirga imtechensis AK7 TaxID=1237149 RepID=L8JSG1_9BACT|nr:NADH-quinone oxidoreductase subunit A [Fulvivirga imtechensis]ELR70292.1 NADH ubiquinone oxidoreductase chain A [Fulvivirga imtechensis AK7]